MHILLSSYEAFTKTDNILVHKIYLNKLKRIEIMQTMLCSQNTVKLNLKSLTEK